MVSAKKISKAQKKAKASAKKKLATSVKKRLQSLRNHRQNILDFLHGTHQEQERMTNREIGVRIVLVALVQIAEVDN